MDVTDMTHKNENKTERANNEKKEKHQKKTEKTSRQRRSENKIGKKTLGAFSSILCATLLFSLINSFSHQHLLGTIFY